MITYTVTQIWLFAALLFTLFEMGTPGLFFSLSFAFGSLGSAVAAYNGLPYLQQWGVFFASTIVALLCLKAWVAVDAPGTQVHTNTDALIGKQGTVVKEATVRRATQVRVGGEYWSAQTENDQELKNGTKVKIVNVTGAKLIVKKIV